MSLQVAWCRVLTLTAWGIWVLSAVALHHSGLHKSTVDSHKFEYGPRTIYAGSSSSSALELEDSPLPTFWLLLWGRGAKHESSAPDAWADPESQSTLGLCDLRHGGIRAQELGWYFVDSPREFGALLYHTIVHRTLYSTTL